MERKYKRKCCLDCKMYNQCIVVTNSPLGIFKADECFVFNFFDDNKNNFSEKTIKINSKTVN